MILIQINSVQFSRSVVSDSLDPMDCSSQAYLSITNSQSLLRLMFIELVLPANHLILCHPLLLSPSIFPSIRVFSNESVLHIRWPMYWSFSFNISPSNEYSGLVSFRIDWLDLLAVQFNSVHFRHSVVSNCLQPRELQHARPPCPSPTPRVHPNPCPLHQ